jgi:Tfp pilus assembly major pilin PilA
MATEPFESTADAAHGIHQFICKQPYMHPQKQTRTVVKVRENASERRRVKVTHDVSTNRPQPTETKKSRDKHNQTTAPNACKRTKIAAHERNDTVIQVNKQE